MTSPSERRSACPIRKGACPVHHIMHGKEAEELRAGIEKLLAVEGRDVDKDDLILLLDQVDARDSLAFLEATDDEDEEECDA